MSNGDLPFPPTDVQHDGTTLTWRAPVCGLPLLGFRVAFRPLGGVSQAFVREFPADTLSARLTDPGRYTVLAVFAAGVSVPSDEVQVAPDATA